MAISFKRGFEFNTWSDFDDNLLEQTDGDITKDKDVEAIKNSLRNICSTLQKSRRMLPQFATNIQYLLFEPTTEPTARHIAETLIESINRWDNRVQLTGVDIVPNEDQNRYDCEMRFALVNDPNIEYEINFILKQN